MNWGVHYIRTNRAFKKLVYCCIWCHATFRTIKRRDLPMRRCSIFDNLWSNIVIWTVALINAFIGAARNHDVSENAVYWIPVNTTIQGVNKQELRMKLNRQTELDWKDSYTVDRFPLGGTFLHLTIYIFWIRCGH